MAYKSDYREERLELRKSINAQNKRRGKQMERRVMKELGGTRVPMSGSGSIKGDGMIMHPRIGYIFVECKMSAAMDARGKQRLNVSYSWFDTMDVQASVMNARFPILVIHHHDATQDYVIVRSDYFEKYVTPGVLIEPVFEIDTGVKNYWSAERQKLEVVLNWYTMLMLLRTNRGVFVVCTLRYFKELLSND